MTRELREARECQPKGTHRAPCASAIPPPLKLKRETPRRLAARLLNRLEWQRKAARELLARADELEEQVQQFLIDRGEKPL